MLRIAFCISGQLRDQDLCFPLAGRFARELQADVFISTWSQQGTKTTGVVLAQQLHRMFGEKFTRLLPLSIVTNKLNDAFPDFEAEVSRRSEKVSDPQIRAYFPNAIIDIEDEILCLDLDHKVNDTNSLRMLYKMWRCNELKRASEKRSGFPYDLVVRFRPDVAPLITTEIAQEMLSDDPENSIWTLQSNTSDFAHDVVAISTSKVGDYYASLFGKAALSTSRPWKSIHLELYNHLIERGLVFKGITLAHGLNSNLATANLLQRQRMNRSVLLDLIRCDRVVELDGGKKSKWKGLLGLMSFVAKHENGQVLSYADLNKIIDLDLDIGFGVWRELLATYYSCSESFQDQESQFAFGILLLIADLAEGGPGRLGYPDVMAFTTVIYGLGLALGIPNPFSDQALDLAKTRSRSLMNERVIAFLDLEVASDRFCTGSKLLESHGLKADFLAMRFDHELYRRHDRSAAKETATLMLERYPDDWRGFDKNSHYLAATGRLEDSLAQTHKALSLSPKNGGLHTRAGRLLLSQGKLAEAAQAFRDAIPLWHHELPWMGLIETLVRQGDSEVAREVAASAVRRFPDRLDIEPMVNQRLAVG